MKTLAHFPERSFVALGAGLTALEERHHVALGVNFRSLNISCGYE